MAVLRNITTSVIVNRKASKEYDALPDDGEATDSSITKYIEVKPDGVFCFEFKVAADFDWGKSQCLTFWIFIDGGQATSTLIEKSDRLPDRTWYDKVEGSWKVMADGDHKFFEWNFQDLGQRDDRPGEDQEAWRRKCRDLGTLTVRAARGRIVKAPDGTQKGPRRERVIGHVPESALKDKSLNLQAGYEPGFAEGQPPTPGEVSYDDKYPLVTFHFMYRDRRALKTKRVIPNSPDPVPLMRKNVNEMTDAEKIEYITRTQAEEARRERRRYLKRERPDGKNDDSDGDSSTDDEPVEVPPPAKKQRQVIELD